MSDLALMAAQTWAQSNIHRGLDPVEFGHKVALAYLACVKTKSHAGDEVASAAALAELSRSSRGFQTEMQKIEELYEALSRSITEPPAREQFLQPLASEQPEHLSPPETQAEPASEKSVDRAFSRPDLSGASPV